MYSDGFESGFIALYWLVIADCSSEDSVVANVAPKAALENLDTIPEMSFHIEFTSLEKSSNGLDKDRSVISFSISNLLGINVILKELSNRLNSRKNADFISGAAVSVLNSTLKVLPTDETRPSSLIELLMVAIHVSSMLISFRGKRVDLNFILLNSILIDLNIELTVKY